jgi:hypothetical protein
MVAQLPDVIIKIVENGVPITVCLFEKKVNCSPISGRTLNILEVKKKSIPFIKNLL